MQVLNCIWLLSCLVGHATATYIKVNIQVYHLHRFIFICSWERLFFLRERASLYKSCVLLTSNLYNLIFLTCHFVMLLELLLPILWLFCCHTKTDSIAMRAKSKMNNKQDKKNYKTQIGFSWPSEISLQKPDWGAQKKKQFESFARLTDPVLAYFLILLWCFWFLPLFLFSIKFLQSCQSMSR